MKTILCLGDSITDGNHLFSSSPLGNGYVSFLEKKLTSYSPQSFQLINRGQDGFTVARLLERLDRWITPTPDMITLLIGVNDLGIMMNTLRSHEQKKELMKIFFQNFEEILHVCSQKNIFTILLEPFVFPWPSEYRSWLSLQKEMSLGLASLAKNYQFPYIYLQEILLAEALTYGFDFITTDGIHLTSEGHRMLSEFIFQTIQKTSFSKISTTSNALK